MSGIKYFFSITVSLYYINFLKAMKLERLLI